MSRLRILVVEDSERDTRLLLRELRRGGFDTIHERVETAEELEQALLASPWDVVVSDYSMPQFDGRKALEILRRSGRDIPFIIVSGTVGEEVAVEAMKAGANDYLLKNSLRRLCPAVRRELGEVASRNKMRQAEERARVAEREQRRLEQRMLASQRMEAVGRLAGGVAHDFNNVLTVIQSYCDFLLRRFPEGQPAHDDVTVIQEAAHRAARLTNQLLGFSRRQPQKLEVIDLSDVVRELEKMLPRLIREDIDLCTELSDDPVMARTDVSQIEQILMNLAVNARDAMPDGGTLTIETANVDLDEAYVARKGETVAPGPYVMLAVTDTGTGMDAEIQEHVFEPFFTTKDGMGTGLGLSTVYGIVKQNSGYLWIYSELGHGTTFKIYLPRIEGTPEQRRPARRSAPAGGDETILLVEDEALVRRAAERILETAGYQVLVAGHGNDALRVAERHAGPLHLLLTDVVMPSMSGKELAIRMLDLRPTIRVVYMSGYTDNLLASRGVLENGAAYLQKPFSAESLLRQVREVLDA